jgi:probable DNA metabolism protein
MNPAAAVASGEALLVRSFAEWREVARELLAFDIAPAAVTWGAAGWARPAEAPVPTRHAASPFAGQDSGDQLSGAPPGAQPVHNGPIRLTDPKPTPHLPRTLLDMLQSAACCRAPDRWAFLYRVVWRWQHGEHEVQSAADEDGARLQAMVKAVHREEHDMHANIRFRERPAEAGPPRFVAWFEPAHDVLPQVAQHFVSRMGRVSWMIATPEASVLWDGSALHNCGPLMDSGVELDGAGEARWLTYYRSIFKPARPNADLLKSHIPLPLWHNLPEGAAKPAPVSQAASGARRTGQAETAGQKRGATIPIAPEDARAAGDHPSTLDQCRRCDLWQNATQAVGGAGPKRARIMLVGEQPGDQEDLAGAPFVGPAGKLLDRVFEKAGLDRRTLYLTNAVKHFKWEPRGKRRLHKTPAQREIEACSYWLEKELAAVKPDVIVALGSTALKAVLGTSHVTLKDTLGQPIRHDGRWVVTVYHPSYVLRVPDAAAKEQAFAVMVDGLKLANELLTRPGNPPATPP